MSWGSDKRHFSHLPLPPGFFPFAPTRSCDRLAAALARHMFQKKSFSVRGAVVSWDSGFLGQDFLGKTSARCGGAGRWW